MNTDKFTMEVVCFYNFRAVAPQPRQGGNISVITATDRDAVRPTLTAMASAVAKAALADKLADKSAGGLHGACLAGTIAAKKRVFSDKWMRPATGRILSIFHNANFASRG